MNHWVWIGLALVGAFAVGAAVFAAYVWPIIRAFQLLLTIARELALMAGWIRPPAPPDADRKLD